MPHRGSLGWSQSRSSLNQQPVGTKRKSRDQPATCPNEAAPGRQEYLSLGYAK